jgi:high affinity Mn2+ porin
MLHNNARFHSRVKLAAAFCSLATAWAAASIPARCQSSPPKNPPAPAPTSPADDSSSSDSGTFFPHSETSRFWISGQANVVLQWHPTFNSPYQGFNSMSPEAQSATTRVLTLYTGLELTHTTEVLVDVEDATGGGIGNAVGLAGITDLDDVRTVQGIQLSKAPYLARLQLHQIIPLSSDTVPNERGPQGLATSLPARRIEFRIGKFDLADFFDNNSIGSDSHLQFLNWTVDNNGAWDYAANTRGYTDGAMVEYDDRHWALRFAEALMPKLANGIELDADLARARSENTELELHHTFWPKRDTVLRLLSYVNHGNMGSYKFAIAQFLAGETPCSPGTVCRPVITDHPLQTTIKYGFGVNLEQPVNDWLGIFARWGWNEGQHESFAYTEDDETFLVGAGLQGSRWKRKLDRAGLAFVSNGISRDHQQYLALGGLGFLLGDGQLEHYGRENIVEAYYTVHMWRGVYASFDLQHINNPGYNRDRGPVLVLTPRLHLEF